jgi:hypothetical protein
MFPAGRQPCAGPAARGPQDLGLVRRPPAPCSPTLWTLLAAGAVVVAVELVLPAGSGEVDGVDAHRMATSCHAMYPT